MTREDRDYFFLMRTVDVGGLSRERVQRRLDQSLKPVWSKLVAEGHLRAARALWRVGDVDLSRDAPTGGDWQLTLFAEVSETAEPTVIAEVENLRVSSTGALAPPLAIRSRELLVRRAGSGTAVPRELNVRLPEGVTAACEHIWVPAERWDDYQEAMRTVFGPVGLILLRDGAAHRVTITETVTTFERAELTPAWNQVHVLEGRFGGDDDLVAASTRAIQEVLGPETDIHAELAKVSSYRRKPAMTNNVEICVAGVGA